MIWSSDLKCRNQWGWHRASLDPSNFILFGNRNVSLGRSVELVSVSHSSPHHEPSTSRRYHRGSSNLTERTWGIMASLIDPKWVLCLLAELFLICIDTADSVYFDICIVHPQALADSRCTQPSTPQPPPPAPPFGSSPTTGFHLRWSCWALGRGRARLEPSHEFNSTDGARIKRSIGLTSRRDCRPRLCTRWPNIYWKGVDSSTPEASPRHSTPIPGKYFENLSLPRLFEIDGWTHRSSRFSIHPFGQYATIYHPRCWLSSGLLNRPQENTLPGYFQRRGINSEGNCRLYSLSSFSPSTEQLNLFFFHFLFHVLFLYQSFELWQNS